MQTISDIIRFHMTGKDTRTKEQIYRDAYQSRTGVACSEQNAKDATA
jgi:hypothetical protein